MPIQTVLTDAKVPIKVWTADIEESARVQLVNTGNLPGVFRHIAVMPDVHMGIGATIGSVVATKTIVCPAAVGVDIGCGMMAVKTSFDGNHLAGKLAELRSQIERSIPVGRGQHRVPVQDSILALDGFTGLTQKVEKLAGKAQHQVATLGGGNHFIEVCLDEDNQVWIMLHSGSRNIGNNIAKVHIECAKGLMKQYLIELPDPELAYLAEKTPEFDSYWRDVQWAQRYARINRELMMERILDQIHRLFGTFEKLQTVNCHHNYVDREHHFGSNVIVTRKGAVRAREGDMGIIPGSMGVASYIVKGRGNDDSFHSCSHGAGRRMSRTKARATFNEQDLCDQTAGVECRKDAGVVDEIPGAYKDIDQVMRDQEDLVEVVAKLKQIICVKG